MKALLRAPMGALLLALLMLAGCAQPPLPRTSGNPEAPVWRGRLALRIDNAESRSFFAGFELSGNARTGELSFFNPVGSTVADLLWTPHSALLRNDGQTRQFNSLDALITEATGTSLPIAAMFEWLDGRNTEAAGWQADLSQLAQGRLLARRTQPVPAAELRLILEP